MSNNLFDSLNVVRPRIESEPATYGTEINSKFMREGLLINRSQFLYESEIESNQNTKKVDQDRDN